MKAYITKYALTDGVELKEGEIIEDYFKLSEKTYSPLVFKNDFHGTAGGAILRCEEMRTAKIKSLKKQIAKLEALDFVDMVRKAGE